MGLYTVNFEYKMEPEIHSVDSIQTGKTLVAKWKIPDHLNYAYDYDFEDIYDEDGAPDKDYVFEDKNLEIAFRVNELLKGEKYVEAYDLFFSSGLSCDLSCYCDIEPQEVLTKEDL